MKRIIKDHEELVTDKTIKQCIDIELESQDHSVQEMEITFISIPEQQELLPVVPDQVVNIIGESQTDLV